MTESFLPREHGDIQTAVVTLVDRVAPIVPVTRQPDFARKIAEVIASAPSSMGNNMFLRQSIIRGHIATSAHVIDGLAAWVTVLFDLANLQQDRNRALEIKATVPDEALGRLTQALSSSRNGCIIAVPHVGSLELFVADLKDRGFNVGFLFTIGSQPTPTEKWIYEGRSSTRATPIAVARRSTGAEISKVLENNGVLVMVSDVYPNAKHKGIDVKIEDAELRYPPGPARFARAGTPILPGFASVRDAEGFSMNIFDPLDYRAEMSVRDAATDFTQRLADQMGGFTAERPEAYWLWHPIPNDPYFAFAQRQRPELLSSAVAALPDDDEAVALAIEALDLAWIESGLVVGNAISL